MPTNANVKLVKKEQLKEDIFKFTCESKEISNNAKPGQFVEIKISESYEPFLRRPISIYNVNKQDNLFEIIFQVKGRGTNFLSKLEEGDFIDVVGPLGNGIFKLNGHKNVAIIGGGIGIFPLYEFAKEAQKEANTNIYLGFRSKDFVVLEDEFKNVANNLIITTDDGTYGNSGFAINYLEKNLNEKNIDAIYACGPLPMLKAVKKLAESKNIFCQISLEQRMACGVGACMGCSVKLTTEDVNYARVCKDGPVFDSKSVEI